jgi:protein-tyrosine phosphatase
MIDLHFHALPGLDDGPPDLAAAVALVGAAAAEGVEAIVATPHVNWAWHNTAPQIADAVARLGAELAAQSVAVEIHAGAEVALTLAHELGDAELRGLRLGGGPWLLIEAPHTPGATAVEHMLSGLQQRGHRVVLAHVERCPAFLADEPLLRRLVAGGMLASITAGSLSGRHGRDARRGAELLVSAGLIHNVSSDAHNRTSRPPGLLRDLDAAGLRPQAEWLVRQMPRAILAGSELPPPPSWPPRRAHPRRLPRLGRRR